MPVHDWSGIEPGIFHDFHHAWIEEIKRSLNAGILPPDYYALAEQFAGGFGPDVLTLQFGDSEDSAGPNQGAEGNGGLLLAPPKLAATAETEMEFYRRKQSHISVRHTTDDKVVAIVEVVSHGNKSSQRALSQFTDKAAQLMDHGIHLLILDVQPPSSRDPHGIHSEIWEYITGQPEKPLPSKPLTLAAYEASAGIRCFVQHVAVGERLPEMPLFLKWDGQVPVPLERTYGAAVEAMPRRWRKVLEEKN
ncbi:MAG TPA: DUF4058 family protein [Pirellulaceae bacterium]|jgi:hypothetical protein